jgi:hypothetical protein
LKYATAFSTQKRKLSYFNLIKEIPETKNFIPVRPAQDKDFGGPTARA